MTPSEWNTALNGDVSWPKIYMTVAPIVREFLVRRDVARGDQRMLTTSDLVERLYPAALARAEGITARDRLFKAVLQLAKRELADCCVRDTEPRPQRFRGANVYGWRWHKPDMPNAEKISFQPKKSKKAPHVCPHCGCDINKPKDNGNGSNDHGNESRVSGD